MNSKLKYLVTTTTGKSAEDFETIARRYFQQENMVKKTFKGQWSAFKQFMQVVFSKHQRPKKWCC